MSQAGTKLRRGQTGYFHWCPGCEEMHPLPDRWTFNGDVERPTFSPSFLHTVTTYAGGVDAQGIGIGERRQGRCHYILTDGVLNFCSDSTHALAGQAVPLPVLPEHLRDHWDWL